MLPSWINALTSQMTFPSDSLRVSYSSLPFTTAVVWLPVKDLMVTLCIDLQVTGCLTNHKNDKFNFVPDLKV